MSVPTAPSAPPAAPGSQEGDGRVVWWWCAAGFVAILAMVGVLRPRAALAALLAVAIGLAGTAAVYALVSLLRRVRPAPRSAFAPAPYTRPSQPLPHHIARIAPDPSDRSPLLTAGARTAIVTIATERLWSEYGLNLHDPSHQAEIERIVSSDLWEAIRPDRVDRQGRVVPRPRLLHSHLDPLLDDLESIANP